MRTCSRLDASRYCTASTNRPYTTPAPCQCRAALVPPCRAAGRPRRAHGSPGPAAPRCGTATCRMHRPRSPPAHISRHRTSDDTPRRSAAGARARCRPAPRSSRPPATRSGQAPQHSTAAPPPCTCTTRRCHRLGTLRDQRTAAEGITRTWIGGRADAAVRPATRARAPCLERLRTRISRSSVAHGAGHSTLAAATKPLQALVCGVQCGDVPGRAGKCWRHARRDACRAQTQRRRGSAGAPSALLMVISMHPSAVQLPRPRHAGDVHRTDPEIGRLRERDVREHRVVRQRDGPQRGCANQ